MAELSIICGGETVEKAGTNLVFNFAGEEQFFFTERQNRREEGRNIESIRNCLGLADAHLELGCKQIDRPSLSTCGSQN